MSSESSTPESSTPESSTDPSLWNSLTIPWKSCVEEAWTAYRAGSLPIGAVVSTPSGEVVARGRNRIHEPSGEPGTLFGHKLSHAEMNALITLDVSSPDASELELFTTTEPCPLCVGAIRMSDVAKLSFAARDPWAGSASMFKDVPYIRRGNIRVSEPRNRLLEDALVSIQIEYFLGSRPRILEDFVKRYERVLPSATRAGHNLHRNLILQKLARNEAPASTMLDTVAFLLQQPV